MGAKAADTPASVYLQADDFRVLERGGGGISAFRLTI
jgi:hypothetical protein